MTLLLVVGKVEGWEKPMARESDSHVGSLGDYPGVLFAHPESGCRPGAREDAAVSEHVRQSHVSFKTHLSLFPLFICINLRQNVLGGLTSER